MVSEGARSVRQGGESSVAAPPQGGEGEQHSITHVNNNINGMASCWMLELDDDTPHDYVRALMLQS